MTQPPIPQAEKQEALAALLARGPVVPVLTVDDAASAVALGRALVAGGLSALEVTLRTPAALEAMRAMIAEIPEAAVGAGTVLTAQQVEAVSAAQAAFMVSPGMSPDLLAAAEAVAVPLLPGVATAGEAMTCLERGYHHLKFFPAEPAGGVAYLKALAAPLPQARFCPTGGVGVANAPSYLTLPNVVCVGGSWVAPAEAIAVGDWARIEALARASRSLGRSPAHG